MKKIYLLIDYVIDSGEILQIKCFYDRQKTIEEGKRSLEYDYSNGYFKNHYKEYFQDFPSLEDLINQWEKQNYRLYDYLEIMESEIYD